MEKRPGADSILAFLTAENPKIDHPGTRSKTLSSSPDWPRPRQVREWTEFNFETLDKIYGGTLMDEARRQGRDLSFPLMHPKVDCIDASETSTTHILTTWNHRIITTSLDLVKHFNPCYWVPRSGEGDDHKGGEVQEATPSTEKQKSNSAKAKEKIKADGGALILTSPREADSSAEHVERLPKDYKVAEKWNSTFLKRRIDKFGMWRPGTQKDNKIMPIRQLYHYCIQHGCRYGCILTTLEAFIIRIRPRPPKPASKAQDRHDHKRVVSLQDKKELKQSLIRDGLMEYVSIPWHNYNPRDPGEYRSLTFNLGLWFIHILAGNNHEVAWTYDDLVLETLRPQPEGQGACLDLEHRHLEPEATDEMPQAEHSAHPIISPRKRKRSKMRDDAIYFSFTSNRSFESEVRRILVYLVYIGI